MEIWQIVVIFLLFGLVVAYWYMKRSKNDQDSSDLANLKRMAELVSQYAKKTDRWSREKYWPPADKLYLFIQTKVPEKYRNGGSVAAVTSYVFKEFESIGEPSKVRKMLQYYRQYVLKPAQEQFEKEVKKKEKQ